MLQTCVAGVLEFGYWSFSEAWMLGLGFFCSSVNAKQLAQSVFPTGPSRCESGHGCHCSQGVISSARRSAKAEVRGANPRESAIFKAPVPQQLQGEFRKLVFVGASPTRGSIPMVIMM